MGTKKPDFGFRVLLLGENEVGKTSIIRRFREDVFSETYEQTPHMDMIKHIIEVDEKKVLLLFIDKSINEFVTRTFHHFKRISALLIVYDVTEQESFEAVPRFINESIAASVDETIPKSIVGNKIDLEDRRAVQYTTGKELADENGFEYAETSAKSSSNINEMLLKLVRDMIEREKTKPKIQDTTKQQQSQSTQQQQSQTAQQKSEKKSSFCSLL